VNATIAVAITVKVDARGHDADSLIADAVLRALSFADNAAERRNVKAPRITVEGATALVNREALA
jgi:hypothetical protein